MTQLTAKELPVPDSMKNQATRLYRAAQQHIQQGNWIVALSAVEELLKSYPQVQELKDMQRDLLERIAQLGIAPYKKDPLYRAAARHLQEGRWASGLTLVERLLKRFPGVEELTAMQNELAQRVGAQKGRRLRGRLLLILVLLSMTFMAVSAVFLRYLRRPTPLAEIIAPIARLDYAPHYLFSIYGIDKPVGVGVSPQGDRIYVSEMGGARLVKMFDQDGNPAGAIELPHTQVGERAPVYLATDQAGQVYISDRKQHAIYIFNRDGAYINTLLGPSRMLSEYVESQSQGQLTGQRFSYNLFQNTLFYQTASGAEQSAALSFLPEWSPLGVRIDAQDRMYLTDVAKDRNVVIEVSLKPQAGSSAGQGKAPPVAVMGSTGSGEGEFLFPNSAMSDSKGRVYVADGNNGRISVWNSQGEFLFNFGKGVGNGALSLPRGIIIDRHDRLFVVDAVGQDVKAYDVSGEKPVFLYAFGDFGSGDGLFNYPNDIALDGNGRLYIADRENNRIQVWSF